MASTTVDHMDPIQAAYAEAEARYKATSPASRAAHEAATASLPGGNTRSVLHWEPYPLCISSAAGYTLRDADGNTYTDLLGEYSAAIYGHSHPVILAAIEETVRRGLSYGGPHAAEAKLAGIIRDRFPSMERLRFTNSGTEANLLAIAAAKVFTRRRRGKVVVFEGGYHGGVLVFPVGCAKVWNNSNNSDNNNSSSRSKYEALAALNAPHDFLVATYNDIASVDELVDARVGDEGLAAILVEPMLGSGGGVCATRDFLVGLRRVADERGALLVFDEVMTSRMYDGGGIQGGGFPSSSSDDDKAEGFFRPDLTTLGKYIGGGMSCGVFGGRADVMALFDPRAPDALPHAGTFNNNVLTMGVGARGLEEVFTREAARALHCLGDEVRGRINGFADDDDDDGGKGRKRRLRVLGCGSILVFHFTGTRVVDIGSPADWMGDEDPRLLDLFHLEMLREGFYLARRGYVTLGLPFLGDEGRKELDRFVEAVKAFVDRFRDLIELGLS